MKKIRLALLLALSPAIASAQLTPEDLYNAGQAGAAQARHEQQAHQDYENHILEMPGRLAAYQDQQDQRDAAAYAAPLLANQFTSGQSPADYFVGLSSMMRNDPNFRNQNPATQNYILQRIRSVASATAHQYFDAGDRTSAERISTAWGIVGPPQPSPPQASVPAAAPDRQQGVLAYRQGDYAAALALFKQRAERGDANAQYDLGLMYAAGQGVPQDNSVAMGWFHKSAAEGNALGQFQVGFMCANGLGVARDYAQAEEWYRKAAAKGNAAAQNNLGCMYRDGLGVPKDSIVAYALFSLSASVNGVSNDLAAIMNNRNMIASGMTPAQIEDAQALTREMQQDGVLKALDAHGTANVPAAAASATAAAAVQKGYRAIQSGDYATAMAEFKPLAEQGNATAQANLGTLYLNGQGVPQDYAVALGWFRKSAAQEDAAAQLHVGGMYANGQGVPQDYTEAMRWIRKSAAQGNALAQLQLGMMYVNGQGVPQDDAAAIPWLRKAAAQGDANAQASLGVIYSGKGVPEGDAEALGWFRKAAAQGNDTAQDFLGMMYFSGRGVPKDYAEAAELFRKSAAQGNAHAQSALGLMYSEGWGVPEDIVAAYALFNLSASVDTSSDNQAMSKRSQLGSVMTPAQIADAQALTLRMQQVGVLKALENR